MNNKQLEDTLREQSKWNKARLIVRGAIEDDLGIRMAMIKNCRLPKTQQLFGMRNIGHVDGEVAFRYNGSIYVLDIHPGTVLAQVLPRVNGHLLEDYEMPIDAEFILDPEIMELTATKLLSAPRQ
jgi:hypothetical protein